LLLTSSLDKNGLTSGHLAHSLWLIFGSQGRRKWHAVFQRSHTAGWSVYSWIWRDKIARCECESWRCSQCPRISPSVAMAALQWPQWRIIGSDGNGVIGWLDYRCRDDLSHSRGRLPTFPCILHERIPLASNWDLERNQGSI